MAVSKKKLEEFCKVMTRTSSPVLSTPKSRGYSGVPGKGGKTLNATIPGSQVSKKETSDKNTKSKED